MLRIRISGFWTAPDFAIFYSQIQNIAEFFETGEYPGGVVAQPGPGSISIRDATLGSALHVRRIQYGSPGVTDLVGLAGVLEQIRLFLQYLIDLWVHRSDRELSREEKRVELAERKAAFLASPEIQSNPEFVSLLQNENVDPLLEAISARRIVGVEIVD